MDGLGDRTEARLRQDLAACYRIFAHLGWTELIYNHITLRLPGPGHRFLINPFGLHYSEVTASNLVTVNFDGTVIGESRWGVNPAGFVIHGAIHAAVPQAHCVMHTHTTASPAVVWRARSTGCPSLISTPRCWRGRSRTMISRASR